MKIIIKQNKWLRKKQSFLIIAGICLLALAAGKGIYPRIDSDSHPASSEFKLSIPESHPGIGPEKLHRDKYCEIVSASHQYPNTFDEKLRAVSLPDISITKILSEHSFFPFYANIAAKLIPSCVLSRSPPVSV